MVIIPLLKDHRLKSDTKQWIFQREYINKQGETAYKNIGYYTTIEGAARASYEYFKRHCDADGIIEFNRESKRILTELATALSPLMEITFKDNFNKGN